MTWQERAACADPGMGWAPLLTSHDPDLALRAAAHICPRCPVRAACAAQGAAETHPEGIYGGLYVREGVWSTAPRRRGRKPSAGAA